MIAATALLASKPVPLRLPECFKAPVAPGLRRGRVRRVPGQGSCPRVCSDRVMVSKETVRRVGIERCQSRIEAEPRRAVGTQDRVRLAHIDVDVRVVLRWGLADTHEFLHPDADFRDAAVVFELRIAAAGHRLTLL
jgi:hypothetical protein